MRLRPLPDESLGALGLWSSLQQRVGESSSLSAWSFPFGGLSPFSRLFLTVFSSASSSLPSSTSWVLSLLHLFLLHRPFLPFLLFSFSCLFLSLAFSFSFSPFSLALSFLLGFTPLSVCRSVFLCFLFACFCVLAVCSFIFRFYLILPSFTSLLVSVFLWSVLRFSFLSVSPFFSPLPFVFLRRLYSSAVCIPSLFVFLRGSSTFC